MLDWIPTCRIGYRHTWWDTWSDNDKPAQTCLITGSPIRVVSLRSEMTVSDQGCRSPIRYVCLRSGMPVSDPACWSPMGLQQTCQSPMCLWYVSDNNNIFASLLFDNINWIKEKQRLPRWVWVWPTRRVHWLWKHVFWSGDRGGILLLLWHCYRVFRVEVLLKNHLWLSLVYDCLVQKS